MKERIQPKALSDPRPRYSQAILTKPGRLLFIAGQTAVDGQGNIVGKGDIEAQTTQVLENIKAILNETGASFGDIVKITTYITDIKYREGLNRVRRRYFEKDPPTSTLLVVKGLAQEEYLVEIDAIAALD
ncbi:MAG: RidA family protein [Candidatus Binatia bacterium]